MTDDQAVTKAAQSLSQIDSVILWPLSMTLHRLINLILNPHINSGCKSEWRSARYFTIVQKQDYGQIALCGSVAGYRAHPMGSYSVTKAAIINLAESLRAEEPQLDIKVINPGFVRTPMTDKNDFDMPMMIEPEDAARTIANGLQTRRFEIHFPKRFTLLVKILKLCLPFVF